jgi:hypothetical protein
MFEFVDIFAFDLANTVFMAGTMTAMIMLAAGAIWMNRAPAVPRGFVPVLRR